MGEHAARGVVVQVMALNSRRRDVDRQSPQKPLWYLSIGCKYSVCEMRNAKMRKCDAIVSGKIKSEGTTMQEGAFVHKRGNMEN